MVNFRSCPTMMIVLLTLGVLLTTPTPTSGTPTVSECPSFAALKLELTEMKDTIKNLARQSMTQQFSSEERVRSNGDSGIRQVRGGKRGPQNYYGTSHISGSAFMAIHDHSNSDRTIGLGEISVSLNGVDFRTRHNDYKLKMPSTTSKEYHATQDVPFPAVPAAVTKLTNIDDQIAELRQWFKAFKTQNTTLRDYRPYFKPVLCYMEGTWTLDKELDEPFESDRHHLDASSWFELMENVRYTAYTGTKNRLENFAFLPTTIMSVNQTTGLPNYAQWNYRIMCHPVKQDIPTKFFKQVDDLSYRVPKRRLGDLSSNYLSRSARFRLYDLPGRKYVGYTLIDRLMADIPGKDNLPGDLREDSFGDQVFKHDEPDTFLNSGFYHRMFKFGKAGAMGLTAVSRGYSDENCWVAMTTQKRVAPMSLETCKKKKCTSFSNRFSYAIPLEMIYLTPLLTWNPWDLTQHQDKKSATANGENGSKNNPFAGTDQKHHYMTPAAFFKGSTDTSDPADTVRSSVYVLDKKGNSRVTTASGTRIKLQEIEGVGEVRLRFPIAPVYGEGSSVWKELNALRDYVMEFGGGKGGGPDPGRGDGDGTTVPDFIDFETSDTTTPTDHFHAFSIGRDDYLAMKAEPSLLVVVTTSQAAGHTHDLAIRFHSKRGFEYTKCDGKKTCWDNHPRQVMEMRKSF